MRHALNFTLVACMIVGAGPLAGCSSEQPAGTRGMLRLDSAAVDLVVGTGTEHDEARLLTRAENELIRRCMAAQDQPYSTDMPRTQSATDAITRPDPVSRRSVGYGLAAAFTQVGSGDPVSASLPPERQVSYDRALSGGEARQRSITVDGTTMRYDTDGCIAGSRAELYGDLDSHAALSLLQQKVRLRIDAAVADDRRYREAVTAWSGCMQKHGHRYATPEEARSRLGERFAADGATAELRRTEIAVAVADADCARDSGLVATAADLRRTLVARLPGELLQRLPEAAATRLTGVQRAATIVPPTR